MGQRVLDIDSGVAMIVTDLHGEGKVYRHLRDKFIALQTHRITDRFILCGDLIHGYGSEDADESLDMLLDVMRLQEEMGRERVILLLGNHEMPHIYSITLSKGSIEFTPRFEAALAKLDQLPRAHYRRKDVIHFLMGLPFYVRTKAGVLITHAGATPSVTTAAAAAQVLDFDHEAVLTAARILLRQYDPEQLRSLYARRSAVPYGTLAQYYLAVSGEDDPRYDDLLNTIALDKSAAFELLWDVLFSRNEADDGLTAYCETVTRFLRAISEISPWEQQVIVAGHIGVSDGFGEIGTQQLRLASYAHAQPKHLGRYLLLDCAKPVFSASELLPDVCKVFEA